MSFSSTDSDHRTRWIPFLIIVGGSGFLYGLFGIGYFWIGFAIITITYFLYSAIYEQRDKWNALLHTAGFMVLRTIAELIINAIWG